MNGVVAGVTTPVSDTDVVLVQGVRLRNGAPKGSKEQVFLCYKLRGELVTYQDPAGRPTLFDRLRGMGLPDNLIPVGRLDFKSEGLMVLTTSGSFARYMELPENELVRRYRARISRGVLTDKHVTRLGRGLQVEGARAPYKPMQVSAHFRQLKSSQQLRKESRELRGKKGKIGRKRKADDVQKVDKDWIDVCVTEGKYREVRKALGSMGLFVDRLIRTEFGPYALGGLGRGDVVKVDRRDLEQAQAAKKKKQQQQEQEKEKEKEQQDVNLKLQGGVQGGPEAKAAAKV